VVLKRARELRLAGAGWAGDADEVRLSARHFANAIPAASAE
jgi:hypothetical protein